MMLTINELAKRTGLSSYEIRRRVHNGLLPHNRVGAKQTKILINEDIFNEILTEESVGNITKIKNNNITDIYDSNDSVGYDRLRAIN